MGEVKMRMRVIGRDGRGHEVRRLSCGDCIGMGTEFGPRDEIPADGFWACFYPPHDGKPGELRICAGSGLLASINGVDVPAPEKADAA